MEVEVERKRDDTSVEVDSPHENVYSGTRNFCLFDRGKTRKLVYIGCTVYIFTFAHTSRPI